MHPHLAPHIKKPPRQVNCYLPLIIVIVVHTREELAPQRVPGPLLPGEGLLWGELGCGVGVRDDICDEAYRGAEIGEVEVVC